MGKPVNKPQGKTGVVHLEPGRVTWEILAFPSSKQEREAFVGKLFTGSFDTYVHCESQPSLAPFTNLIQNDENDLDFTVTTSAGIVLLELAEFAPLDRYGPTFKEAPRSFDPKDKALSVLSLIRQKSAHQGGARRILLIYNTEHAFVIDPITVECVRRSLLSEPPRFERVYSTSPEDALSTFTSELYPGSPHWYFGNLNDQQLMELNVSIPHPLDMRVGPSKSNWIGTTLINGQLINARMSVDWSASSRNVSPIFSMSNVYVAG